MTRENTSAGIIADRKSCAEAFSIARIQAKKLPVAKANLDENCAHLAARESILSHTRSISLVLASPLALYRSSSRSHCHPLPGGFQ